MKHVVLASSILLSLSALVVVGGRGAAHATGVPASCSPGDFKAVVLLQGAMGHREGGVVLTNVSGRACTIHGFAGVQLVDAHNRNMAVHSVHSAAHPEYGRGLSAQIRKQGLVGARGRAFISLRWGNWCGFAPALPITAVVRLPAHSGKILASLRTMGLSVAASSAPPCLGKTLPSSLDEGPIQLVGPRVQVPA